MGGIVPNVLFFFLCVSACLSHAGPVRPTMSETTALGAAMAAGAAEGVEVWSLSPSHLPHVTSEEYEPQINSDGKEAKTHLSMRFSKKFLKPVTLNSLPSSGCYDYHSASLKNLKKVLERNRSVSPHLTRLSVLFTESEFRFARWKKAVQRAMNWETTEPCCNANGTHLSYFRNV